jgi:hypothetical protein
VVDIGQIAGFICIIFLYAISMHLFKLRFKMGNLQESLTCIEAHGQTIELVKWITIGLIAWCCGLFRYIKNLTLKPKLKISKIESHAFTEEIKHEGLPYTLTAFLINMEVSNPTPNTIVVRSFNLCIRRKGVWRWSQYISSITLPSRIKYVMGDKEKILANWFAHSESAYSLFVFVGQPDQSPLIKNGKVEIIAQACTATGEKINCSTKIDVKTQPDFFTNVIDGFLAHVRNPEYWNIPPRFE